MTLLVWLEYLYGLEMALYDLGCLAIDKHHHALSDWWEHISP